MVQFYNGTKAEDYVTLVESEVLPDTTQVEDIKFSPEKKFQDDIGKTIWKLIGSVVVLRTIKIIFLISVIVTIASLSYRAYKQDSELYQLRSRLTGHLYNGTSVECDYSISDGQYNRYYRRLDSNRAREFTHLNGDACLVACINVRDFDPRINGVTISTDPTKKGCWCLRNATTISSRYQSCILETKAKKHNITINSSKYKCVFQPGDGSGGTEVKVGYQKGEECINACLHMKYFDNTVNGVCTHVDPRRSGCWCERGMTSISKSSYYKTCTLIPIDEHPHTRVDPEVCSLRTGHGYVGTQGKILIKKQNAVNCVEDCLHMKHVENSINGVSLNTVDGSCWCLKDLQNITAKYKSCLLVHGNAACAKKNISFVGNDMRNIRNVSSWLDCSDLCRTEGKCKVWTWNGPARQCVLKSSDKGGQKQARGHVSGEISCGAYVCNFTSSVEMAKTGIRISDNTGNACVEDCLTLKSSDPSINGVTVFSDTTRSGCFCDSNMTGIDDTVKTCFLKPKKPVIIDSTSDNVTCDLEPGNGYGSSVFGSEIYMGNLPGNTCLKACLFIRKIDSSINGISVYANSSKPGCWCEKRMRGIRKSSIFKTCKFKYNTTDDIKYVCNFKNGDSNGKGTYVGRLEKRECISTCSNVRQLDSSLTGLTWDKLANSCYCKRNMTRIGEFQTCLMKDVKLTV